MPPSWTNKTVAFTGYVYSFSIHYYEFLHSKEAGGHLHDGEWKTNTRIRWRPLLDYPNHRPWLGIGWLSPQSRLLDSTIIHNQWHQNIENKQATKQARQPTNKRCFVKAIFVARRFLKPIQFYHTHKSTTNGGARTFVFLSKLNKLWNLKTNNT